MYKCLIYSTEDNVATIFLNRPESMNAVNLELATELTDCLARCANDEEVRAVILTGEGNGFCAGADVNYMQKTPSRAYAMRTIIMRFHAAISSVHHMPKPVIAAVNGAATGGGFGLALASDIVIAAEGTRFGTAYLAMGLSGDSGISFFLSRAFGIHRAKRLLFTSEMLDATAAKEIGFVSQIVKREELMVEARKVATKLAHGPTLAIARAKELLNSGLTQGLETQLEYESDGMIFTARTEDFEEAANAFFEKRTAVFRGR